MMQAVGSVVRGFIVFAQKEETAMNVYSPAA
jgi:hypothetical protein